MGSFAFVTWEGGGNVGPAIGIAQELAARGHSCRFLGYERQREPIEGQGLAFRQLARGGTFDRHGLAGEQLLAGLVGRIWACSDHLQDLAEAVEAEATDVLVVDCMMDGALAAAERLPVVAVALVHSVVAGLIGPADSPTVKARFAGALALRAAAGLRPVGRHRETWDRLPTLVTTIRELDAEAGTMGPNVRYVGPIRERFEHATWTSPWKADDERPLVVVSFSTTQIWDQRGRIERTLAALAEEPVRVLVSGPHGLDIPLPANAVAARFVPHELVLPSAAAMVTHCGHGTIATSLDHGVPVVGLPNKAADQPYLAKRIEQLGAGMALDGEAPAGQIREAVRAAIDDPRYRDAARALGAAIHKAPGVSGAAEELEKVAGAIARSDLLEKVLER
jgi:MGT family glycosyltransferase